MEDDNNSDLVAVDLEEESAVKQSQEPTIKSTGQVEIKCSNVNKDLVARDELQGSLAPQNMAQSQTPPPYLTNDSEVGDQNVPSSSKSLANKTTSQTPRNKIITLVGTKEKSDAQGLHGSIDQPSESQNLKESFKYAVITLSWLTYHSSILGSIPLLFVIILLGSSTFFETDNQNMLVYFLFFDMLFVLLLYINISSIFLLLFGRKRLTKLLIVISLPSIGLHILFHSLRIYFGIPWLSFFYFSCFLSNYLLTLWCVMKGYGYMPTVNQDNRNRYDALASDGTPMALFKGMIPNIGLYFLASYFLLKYIVSSNIAIRIIGRILVVPLLANLADSYQNKQLIYKSKEYLKYRMIIGNIINSAVLAILRLMVTDASSIEYTTLLAFSAAVSEMVLRISFIPRTVLTLKLMTLIESRFWRTFISKNKIANLNSIVPQQDSTIPHFSRTSHQEKPRDKTQNPRDEYQNNIGDIGWSLKDLKTLFSLNRGKGDLTELITTYRKNRAHDIAMFEIQSCIFIPVALFLTKPMHKYFAFEPFFTIEELLMNILIQLIFEIFTQIVCIAMEHYYFGVELMVKRDRKHYCKIPVLMQYSLSIFMILYLSVYPFEISPESW